MKLIIDIPQEVLENPHNYCCYALANQIKENYTPIPDNATNGDAIKALFPNGIKIDRSTAYAKRVTKDWWNSPYKRGDTE